MRYSIGVDLGTSTVAVAIGDERGTRAVALSEGDVLPSVVYCAADGTILTGAAALAERDPARTVTGFKRRIGDPTPLVVGGTSRSPEELMAAQLRDVVAALTESRGEAPAAVVLSAPAAWGPYRRERFDRVAELSGVAVRAVVTEPVATATHVVSERGLGTGALLAVFDLGGSTFEATVLRVGPEGIETLGSPEGIEHLGGDDLDDAVRGLVDRRLGGLLSALDPAVEGDAAALAAVDAACTEAKELLSSRRETVVVVPLPDGERRVTITRDEFDEAIRPTVELAVAALRRSVASAGVDEDALATIILSGGSARIPLVAAQVAAIGRPVHATHRPTTTVALGAAEVARRLLESGPVGSPEPDPRDATAPLAGRGGARRRPGRRTVALAGVAVVALAAAALTIPPLLGQAANSFTTAEQTPAQPADQDQDQDQDGQDQGEDATVIEPEPAVVPEPTVVAPVFTDGATAEGLGWFVQSAGVTGDWEVSTLDDGTAARDQLTLTESADGLHAQWSGAADPAQFYAQASGETLDLAPVAENDGALVLDVTVASGTAGTFQLAAHCGYPCGGTVDVTDAVNAIPDGGTRRLVVPASCFTAAGLDPSRVDTPFLAFGTGDLDVSVDDVRWEDNTGADPDALPCGEG
ncbi:Hsp70 family protein [Mycetocola reblochoni]|uniref:Chaperone protein DnaK n=2 Tax=Mycetocola reblochoni TaxID=331618 RepID=A0A1R4I845_9MICO|nr:Hsp70 family protein [Mycetocola reblochoni]SJN15866.1 Chaperone protein DnaK [Mycetocola reblochoni REB411]